jgi:hypothetical protein
MFVCICAPLFFERASFIILIHGSNFIVVRIIHTLQVGVVLQEKFSCHFLVKLPGESCIDVVGSPDQ